MVIQQLYQGLKQISIQLVLFIFGGIKQLS